MCAFLSKVEKVERWCPVAVVAATPDFDRLCLCAAGYAAKSSMAVGFLCHIYLKAMISSRALLGSPFSATLLLCTFSFFFSFGSLRWRMYLVANRRPHPPFCFNKAVL